MADPNAPACTFRSLLCAEEDCDNYALEPTRRAACRQRYADGTDDHTPFCRTNLVDVLEQRRKHPDAAAIVAAHYGPGFPKSALRAAPCSETGAELGYCAAHSNPGGRDAKVKFWEQCEHSSSLRLRGEKMEFLVEYAKYVKTVHEWCRVDLDALVKMPSGKTGLPGK
ncbi:hypothetical protein PG993_002420 [Apiospora rasikravindrae]|uniref:Uncharacterized protein n=1 Tax=Apiospora rasikravindrae TaxID=990691 RepID=A0ABR1TYU1_9PEZI